MSLLPDPVYVRIGDVDVATYVLGPVAGAAADVVLCHGTPWSAHVWAPVAARLSETFRVHLWDMPGYGASPMLPEIPVGLAMQAQRLAGLVQHWGLKRPHLVAHDIGGAVALGAHLRLGMTAASLSLVDVVVLDPWGSPFFRQVREHEHVFAELPVELHEALVRAYVAGAAGAPLDDAWLDALVAPWLGPVGQPAFYRQIAQLVPADTRPLVARLDQVRCPTLVAWGVQDAWIPVEQADRLGAAIPGCAAPTLIADAGHLLPIEQPDALAAVLVAHLMAGQSADGA